MSIEDILDLLPLEITEDLYFQNIAKIIIASLKDINSQLLLKIEVNSDLYEKMVNKSLFLINDAVIISFKYRFKDSICSLGIKYLDDYLYIYYEEKSFQKTKRTILIKSLTGVIVETKETAKENGLYTYYDANVYYYDLEYKEIKTDTKTILDKMFSDEFGIPLNLAGIIRHNFPKYAQKLSIISSENRMKNNDAKLTTNDFFSFLSPWLVNDLRVSLEREYNKDRVLAIKKFLKQDPESSSLNNWPGINPFLKWIELNLEASSEFVISRNIYQNLIPLLTGEESLGIDTKGFIIEKTSSNYYLYEVHFMTEQTIFKKDLISKEEAQSLFLRNPLNQNVAGLNAFFRIIRGR